MEYCTVATGGATCLAGLVALYKLARPAFPVRVNCHFCSQTFAVPYRDADKWNCPGCGQHNGWDAAGDSTASPSPDPPLRYCRPGAGRVGNSLCRDCNLNQELKVTQLARFPRLGAELEEYSAHLERVYRLCPACDAAVAAKLAEQDRTLAPALLEHRLETSRLAGVLDRSAVCSRAVLPLHLLLVTFLLSSMLPHPALPGPVLQLCHTWFPLLQSEQILAPLPPLVVGLVSLGLAVQAGVRHAWSAMALHLLLLAGCLLAAPTPVLLGLTILPAVLAARPEPRRRFSSPARPTSSNRLSQSQPSSPGSVATQDLLDSSVGTASPAPSVASLAPSPASPSLFHDSLSPSIPCARSIAPTPLPVKLSFDRPSDEFSFTQEALDPGQEFGYSQRAAGEERDCDLSSLSLGCSARSPSPARSPFPLQRYSPAQPNLFSPGRRPVLQPARLTSWVAGGYWAGQSAGAGSASLRSSSSGFVSATPSLFSGPLQPEFDRCSVMSDRARPPPRLPPSPPPSLTRPHRRRRATAESSLSQTSSVPANMEGGTRAAPGCWSFTITITPTGLLLATSIAANIGLAALWLKYQ